MAASERVEIESIDADEEENVDDDDEPKVAEIPPEEEEERMQTEQNETPSEVTIPAPISTNDAVSTSSANNEDIISTTSPNVRIAVGESAAF